LLDDFTYLGLDTCAATGLCEDRCPVGINTGELVKVLREEKNAKWQSSANLIGRHFGGVTKILRAGLKASDVGHRVLSTSGMSKITGGLWSLAGNRIPLWTPAMPRASNPAKLSNYQSIIKGDELVYWPSCAAHNFIHRVAMICQHCQILYYGY